MNVSVIICTKDRPEDIVVCFNSLLKQKIRPFETIIIDSSSNNQTNQIYSEYKPKLNLLYYKTKPGLTLQRNVGLKHFKGDVALFIDDDVELDTEYMENIIEIYKDNPTVYGVTGYIKDLPISFIYNLYARAFMLPCFKDGNLQSSGFPTFALPNKNIYVTFLSGCNMSYRKEVFNYFKFDENLKGYTNMEDVDFSYRVSNKYKLMQGFNCTLYHHKSTNSRDDLSYLTEKLAVHHYYQFRKNFKFNFLGLLSFFWSHFGLFIRDLLRMVIRFKVDAMYGDLVGNYYILKNLRRDKIVNLVKKYK